MRVTCPNNDCPIDVPDDFAGTKIRCPHCGHLFIIDEAPPDTALQATAPPPKPREKLEHRIYDGLPPLSVMIALRRERGVLDPEDIRHLEMTEDDWKALAAFETLLRACVSLRAALILGAAAVVCNLLAMAASDGSAGRRDADVPYSAIVVGLSLALVLLGAVIQVGSKALAQARLGFMLDGLFWAAFAALVAVAAIAILSVYHLRTYGAPAIVVGAVCLIVSIALAEANVRVWWAMKQIEPPEISQRLADALRYLE